MLTILPLALVLVAGIAEASPPDLLLRPACDGNGFAGTIEREGVLLRFEACNSEGHEHATVTFSDGSPFIHYEAAAEQDDVHEIGGHTLAEIYAMTPEEHRKVADK